MHCARALAQQVWPGYTAYLHLRVTATSLNKCGVHTNSVAASPSFYIEFVFYNGHQIFNKNQTESVELRINI